MLSPCLFSAIKWQYWIFPLQWIRHMGNKPEFAFWGLEIDSEEMLVHILESKIREITEKIEAILAHKRCTLK